MNGLGRGIGGRWLAVISVALMAGCQTPSPAPVAERPQPPSIRLLHHIVSAGETLHTIAWRYELDTQRLAAVNGLYPPYTLRPGQKLSLDLSGAAAPSSPSTATGDRPVSGATAYPVDGRQPPRAVPQPLPESTPPREGTRPPPVSAPERETSPPQRPSVVPQVPAAASGWRWQWPVKGRVAKEFDAGNQLKGISIYTDSRVAVAAAAPGVVVYAGEGLRGYGRLIIVKHSDEHLSAYAHNHRILVSENDTVSQGQQIAEVGMDSSNRHRLYFEIRENGKPVDPLKHLPK